jgi:stage V sporulation protein S
MNIQETPLTVQETQGGLARERYVAPTNTLLKVASRSRPAAIAGAVAGVIRSGSTATIQAVGAGAVNQAVKAIAIAHSYLRDDGITICCMPSFLEVSIDEQERTAICLLVERRT